MHDRSDRAGLVCERVVGPSRVDLEAVDRRRLDDLFAKSKAVPFEQFKPFRELNTIDVLQPILESAAPRRIGVGEVLLRRGRCVVVRQVVVDSDLVDRDLAGRQNTCHVLQETRNPVPVEVLEDVKTEYAVEKSIRKP